MERKVTVNYANMTDWELARFGLDAGEAYFLRLVAIGAANGDSLYIQVGDISAANEFEELATRAIGPDAVQFARNISPEDGKLATVVKFGMDSVSAYYWNGDAVGEGPRQWTGGVLHVARVQFDDGSWRSQTFAGAASGVQGVFDMATTYTVLTSMGAAWQQRELTLWRTQNPILAKP